MASTIKDVAKRAGVSPITVSRVVNGMGYVHPATRAKVQAAIDELQYIPNRTASNLRSRQTDTLALVLPDITNSFWTTIARGVEDEAWAGGYGVFLCNTDDDPAKEERYLDILLRRRVEGVTIIPTPGSVALLRRLRQRGMQLVVLHRQMAELDVDSVRGDSRGGAFALTAHLLDAGRRRVAYVGGPLVFSSGRERLAGYQAALRAAGLEPDPALVAVGEYSQRTGHRLVAELLRAGEPPEALFIGNSRLALGALRALADAGLRVPRDMAVAAFYDIAALDDYAPLMTTAVQPAYDIGRLGARLLLARIAGKSAPGEEHLLPNRITVRAAPVSA